MSYGFFVKEGKNLKAFKLTSRATFAVVNSYICLEFFSSPAEIIISFSNCQMVTITIIGICHDEINLAGVCSFNNTSFIHKGPNIVLR